MTQFLAAVAIVIAIVAAFNANILKIDTAELTDEIRAMERQIAVETDRIDVLKAEWDYLTNPARIQQLADQHLDLKKTTSAQIFKRADIAAIPFRIPEAEDDAQSDAIANLLNVSSLETDAAVGVDQQ